VAVGSVLSLENVVHNHDFNEPLERYSPRKLEFFSTLSLWKSFLFPRKNHLCFSTQTMVLHLLHVQQLFVYIVNVQPIGRASTACVTSYNNSRSRSQLFQLNAKQKHNLT
jgi:hypothetical protein